MTNGTGLVLLTKNSELLRDIAGGVGVLSGLVVRIGTTNQNIRSGWYSYSQ